MSAPYFDVCDEYSKLIIPNNYRWTQVNGSDVQRLDEKPILVDLSPLRIIDSMGSHQLTRLQEDGPLML